MPNLIYFQARGGGPRNPAARAQIGQGFAERLVDDAGGAGAGMWGGMFPGGAAGGGPMRRQNRQQPRQDQGESEYSIWSKDY